MATVHITTYAQLQAMQSSLADDYILDNDIDCSGEADFVPIAEGEGEVVAPFTGSFDGQGFTISNLRINWTTRNTDFATSRGLFGYCSGATIQNINLDSPKMFSYEESGFICGYALNCSFNDCHVTNAEYNGDVLDTCGGLIGYYKLTGASDKNILDSSAEMYITCDELSIGLSNVGGLIAGIERTSGTNFINIINCTTDFTIRLSEVLDIGVSSLGGFIGWGDTALKITDCSCNIYLLMENFESAGFSYVGGFFGSMENKSEINRCYVTGEMNIFNDFNSLSSMSGFGTFVGSTLGGQIAVVNTPDIIYRECFSTVDLNLECSSAEAVGGFAGIADGSFNKCFYHGNIDYKFNSYTSFGGFFGSNSGDYAIISECYTKGEITLRYLNSSIGSSAFDSCGGFIGKATASVNRCLISNCYSKMNITLDNDSDLEMDFSAMGAFCGVSSSYINNCYATGNISISNSGGGIMYFELVGGFIGNSIRVIQNCFSVGIITISREFDFNNFYFNDIGGFIGLKSTTTITNCAWFTESYALPFGDSSGTMTSLGLGTDEDDNTLFYTTDHPVYNQS